VEKKNQQLPQGIRKKNNGYKMRGKRKREKRNRGRRERRLKR
jgi:hypothetical protein